MFGKSHIDYETDRDIVWDRDRMFGNSHIDYETDRGLGET